jgi:S-disulfanyl-L-cysteine oxidoreductase SoxD
VRRFGGLLAVTLASGLAVLSCQDPEPTDQELARGGELYQAHCVACHGGATGGSISDIPPRHNAEGHTWHHADCDLVDMVRDGTPPRPGYPVMPAFGDELTDEEIRLILEHIKTWWEPEQRAHQAQVTDEVCE